MSRPLRWYDLITINIFFLALTTLSQTNGLVFPLLVQNFVGEATKGARLGEITVPTLMIAAAADSLLTANLADFARLGNATLHVFSRVSHAVPSEAPEELANVIADFAEHGVVTAATLQRGLREMAAAR